jgi:hypothetical protein
MGILGLLSQGFDLLLLPLSFFFLFLFLLVLPPAASAVTIRRPLPSSKVLISASVEECAFGSSKPKNDRNSWSETGVTRGGAMSDEARREKVSMRAPLR